MESGNATVKIPYTGKSKVRFVQYAYGVELEWVNLATGYGQSAEEMAVEIDFETAVKLRDFLSNYINSHQQS